MALTPYRATSDLFNPLEAMFGPLATGRMGDTLRVPSADVIERENDIQVVMEIPGMNPDDLDIDLENNVLTVSGEKREEREQDGDTGSTYHLSERRYGRFSRTFLLPRDVESDNIRARCENGLLRITVPKSERARRRRIEIERGDGGSRRVEARSESGRKN